jgi:hypothetical protein
VELPTYAVGDQLIFAVKCDATDTTYATPDGWTELVNNSPDDKGGVASFRKVADGSEGSSVTLSMSGGDSPWIAGITWVHRGLDYASFPPDTSSLQENPGGSTNQINSPQVTMSHGESTYDVYVVVTAFGAQDEHLPASDSDGYTLIADIGVGTGDPWMALYHKRIADVSAEDPATFTMASNGTYQAHTIAVLAVGDPDLASGDHTHVEADVTDLDHWTEADHDVLDHTGLTGVGGGGSVDDLTDATITGTPADNEVFAYDTGTSEWINQTATEAGLAAASHTHTESDVTDLDHWTETDHDALDHTGLTGVGGVAELDDLTDVDLSTPPADNQILRFDDGSGTWLPEDLPAAGAFDLADADDVTITTVQDGDVLTFDSGTSEWVNEAPSGGGGGSVPEWVSYLAKRQSDETSHADDDFFDDGTLAGTAVTGAGNASWVEQYGKMSVLVDTQGAFPVEVAARVFALTPSAAPVTLETRFEVLALDANNIPGVMVGFSDGATVGDDIAALYSYRAAAGQRRFYNYAGQFNAGAGSTLWTNLAIWTPYLYVRAVWSAANTFKYGISLNGIRFTRLGQAAHSRTLAPTHFFVGAGNVSSTLPMPVEFDYVRINEVDGLP